MRAEEQFDSFYLKTRRALVHQTFALTGDLAAAQRAVRDAYVAAWHHWRKVTTYDDPRDWVRPRAWALAQRRHTARLWQKTRDLSAEDRAVLGALQKVPLSERRALVMVELAGVPRDVSARELNVPQATLETQLRSATARFADELGLDSSAVRDRLLGLGGAASGATLLRPASVRRDGRNRRRTHTVIAAAVATFLAVGSGAFAYEPDGESAETGPLAPPPEGPQPSESAGSSAAASAVPESPLPSADDLLTGTHLRTFMNGRWRVVDTHDNTAGEGINFVCQQERFADPAGLATLVRTFEAPGRPKRSMVQTVEISESAEQASNTYDTVLSWFGGCVSGDVHLSRSYDVGGVADRATVLQLNGWWRAQASYSAAVAQVGQVVTTSVTRTIGGSAPGPEATARTLAVASGMICEQAGRDDCGGRPRPKNAAPPRSEETRGMLSTVDMPPLQGRPRPWVATKTVPAPKNPAATSCDKAEFRRMGATRTRTRMFLEDGNRLPRYFGLAQTYGAFRTERKAAAVMRTIRQRFASCEDRDLAAEVLAPEALRQGPLDGSTWRLLTGISEEREVVYDVGFVRRGKTVAQLTFVPAGGADLAPGAFRNLVIRAGLRLRELG